MKISFVILETGRVLLLAIFASFLAMSFAIGINAEICGEMYGSNAPGGGAAIGMLVLMVVGIPTVIWVVLSEIVLKMLPRNGAKRFFSVLLPSLLAFIWMLFASTSQCN